MRLKCETITCTVRTPMFTYGAIPNKPEIRSQSLKGVLRFWDRALQGERDLSKLFADQSRVWGAAANEPHEQGMESGFGKSKVSIQVIEENVIPEARFPKGNNQILKYLAFGPVMGKHAYSHIRVGSTFKVVLRSHDRALIDRAIRLIAIAGKIGGLGQRARNGWGRFSVKGHSVDVEALVEKGKAHHLLPYTAFSNQSELISLRRRGDWKTVLHEFGEKWKDHLGKKKIEELQFLVAPIQKGRGPRSILSRHPQSLFLILEPVSKDNPAKGYQGKLLYLPYQYLSLAGTDKSHAEVKENVKKLNAQFKDPQRRYLNAYTEVLKNFK